MYVSWTNFTANLKGRSIKEVTCEQCGLEYAYALERSASGEGTSVYGMDDQGAQGRALNRASDNLQRRLHDAFELVPCPSCGAYQARMVAFLKNAHRMWMLLLGAGLILLAIVALFVLAVSQRSEGSGAVVAILAITALVGVCAGVTLIIVRRGMADAYDPNSEDLEGRKQLGQSLAFLKSRD